MHLAIRLSQCLIALELEITVKHKKILTIVGARPQFVKAAVVSRALLQSSSLSEVLVHTGQHYDKDMSEIFFQELDIPAPKRNLGIGGGSHGSNTGRALEQLESVMLEEKPDMVLVYGDTDSTLAGALAAAKLCIPVLHVEAGLRSFNRRMPEEVNRVLTDHVSTVLFVPSRAALDNLRQEGIEGDRVCQVGDVMFDAVRIFGEIAQQRSQVMEQLGLSAREYVLATLHRKENTDDRTRLAAILQGLGDSAVPVVLPLHPRTRARVDEFGLRIPATVRVVDPVGYLDMQALERNALLVATDSGGVQKEAYFHGVRCVTLREETEWVELVELGANVLAGADATKIAAALRSQEPMQAGRQVYGDGYAADAICRYLENWNA